MGNLPKVSAVRGCNLRWPDNTRVEIHGLTSEAGSVLNGLTGRVKCWSAHKLRYDVAIEEGPTQRERQVEVGKIVCAKKANLSRYKVVVVNGSENLLDGID